MKSTYRNRIAQRLTKQGCRWFSHPLTDESSLNNQLEQQQLARNLTKERFVPTAEMRKLQGKSKLSPIQVQVMQKAVKGENVFVGGAAGSGKTETLLQIYEQLSSKRSSLTDSDDMPGILKNGVALISGGARSNPSHGVVVSSRIQIGLPAESTDFKFTSSGEPTILLGTLTDNPFYKNVRVLVIDDVEQLDYESFHTLGMLISRVQNPDALVVQPFEGIQLIAGGDFCSICQGTFNSPTHGNYPFEHPSWDSLFKMNQFELGDSFVHEPEYFKFLQKVRLNGMKTLADAKQLTMLEDDDGSVDAAFKPRSFKEKGSKKKTGYLDPLAGRHLIGPGTNGDPHDCAGYDSHGLMYSKREAPGFALSYYKPLFLELGDLGTYRILVGATEETTSRLSRVSKLVRSSIAKRLRMLLKNKMSNFSSHFPSSYSIFGRPLAQVFTIGEEVTLLGPSPPLHFGSRGTVIDFEKDFIEVQFKTDEGSIVRKLRPMEINCTMDYSIPHVDEVTKETFVEVRKYHGGLTLFPLSHSKMDYSTDMYASLLVNGLYPKSVDPPTVIISGPAFNGEHGSLYAALAHSPSFEKVRVRGRIRTTIAGEEKNIPYARAALFHKYIAGVNMKKEVCPVCKTSLSSPCPMSSGKGPDQGHKSIWERVTDCCKSYYYCNTTDTVMTAEEFKDHEKKMAWVKCECGDSVRLKDLREHRLQKIAEGNFTCSPGNASTAAQA